MAVFSNVLGFDDAPFARTHRGDVLIVGTICARTRLDGVITTTVRRDGRNATDRMIAALERSQFRRSINAVLLQGIAVAGFNVVDVHGLYERLRLPVLVVARKQPNLPAMRAALLHAGAGQPGRRVDGGVAGGLRKWRLIEAAGPMEPLQGIFVQRVGLTRSEAGELLRATTLHGALPEPLRLAHLIAGGVVAGASRGRA